MMRRFQLSILSLAFFSIQSTIAQNVTDWWANPLSCPYWPIQKPGVDGRVNSSGTINFPWQRPFSRNWYMTVTFNSTERDSLAGSLQGYLSVPNNLNASACVYMFSGLNASSTGRGEDLGCTGVLSGSCINRLRGLNNLLSLDPGTNGCPSIPMQVTDAGFKEACPEFTADGVRETFSSTAPLKLYNKTCKVDLPRDTFSRPSDYDTFSTLGQSLLRNPNISQTIYYDRFVRQPIPFVIAAVVDGRKQTQVVCVTPKDVLPGSRVPEGDWPPSARTSNNSPNSTSNNDSNEGSGAAGNSVKGGNVILALFVVAFASLTIF